jgi:hypothetical protein
MKPLVLQSSSSSEGSIGDFIKKVFAPPAWYTKLHPPDSSSSSDSSIVSAVLVRKNSSNGNETKKIPVLRSSSLLLSSSSEDDSLDTFIKKDFAPPVEIIEILSSSSSSTSSVASVLSSALHESYSSESVGDNSHDSEAFYDDCVGSSKVEYKSSNRWYITRLNKRKKRRTER